eukprot:INCI1139.1.p1 GENE.INCI1139.1~~INCI1139.1.p1  ORF type:complete len:232 (-),score=43.55 INCI1139.1:182-877(-)
MKVAALILGAVAAPAAATVLGGLKDEHGCYPSAGYSWCESSQKCIRSWEEDCADSTDSATASNSTVVGANTNGGCLASAGYTFCPELKECVRFWETNTDGDKYSALCPTMMKTLEADLTGSSGDRRSLQLIGGAVDENGCYPSAGYTWCESSSKCIRVWEEDCEALAKPTTTAAAKLLGGKGDDNCCITCGYRWCEDAQKCVQPWMVDDLQGTCPQLYKLLAADELSTHSR